MVRCSAQKLATVAVVLCGLVPCANAQTPNEDFNRGVQALEAHDFAIARLVFSSLVKQHPSAVNYGYLALAEVDGGNLEKGIADFKTCIKLGGASANIRYNLGLAYLEDHQVQAGIQEFQRALSLNPKYSPARYALGVAFLNSGQARKAIVYFDEARRLTPHDPAVWANLVKAQFEAGNDKQAIDTAENAVQSVTEDPRLAVTLATICIHHRQIQTARNLLEDANELMPNNDDVRLLLARVSIMAGEPVEALAVLTDMPQGSEESGEKLFLRGEATALTGDLNAAEMDLVRVLTESPENVEYLVTYAWLQQLQRHHSDAITTLTKARGLEPHSPVIPYRMGVSYYFLGQLLLAEKMCKETLQLVPQYTAAYLLIGAIELKEQDFQTAANNFQKAVNLNPKEASFHRELGVALLKSGKAAEARRQLDLALTIDPKDAEGYFQRARLLASQGARREAIADLKLTIELRPDYLEAYPELAKLYTADGQRQRAAGVLAEQDKIKTSSAPAQDDRLLRNLPDARP
jgi:tetratricopeptide (TPR) repeat protein